MECGLQCGEVKRSPELEHMCATGPRSCLSQWTGRFGNSVKPKIHRLWSQPKYFPPQQTVTYPLTSSLRKRNAIDGVGLQQSVIQGIWYAFLFLSYVSSSVSLIFFHVLPTLLPACHYEHARLDAQQSIQQPL